MIWFDAIAFPNIFCNKKIRKQQRFYVVHSMSKDVVIAWLRFVYSLKYDSSYLSNTLAE